jgi:hypothetical protein
MPEQKKLKHQGSAPELLSFIYLQGRHLASFKTFRAEQAAAVIPSQGADGEGGRVETGLNLGIAKSSLNSTSKVWNLFFRLFEGNCVQMLPM